MINKEDNYNNWRNTNYQDTINTINNILYNNNIYPCVSDWFWNSKIETYRCKVFDQYNKKSTAGKGTNFLACQASGEAEFIERIQGNFIYKRVSNALFFQDEQIINGMHYLPTLNLITGQVENRKFIWNQSHTNGFAAGNTIDEAIIHSLCELVERDTLYRYAFQETKWNNVITLSNKLKERVNNLSALFDGVCYFIDITYHHIPTALFIFQSNLNPEYILFNIQSSANIELAIERCLTETFQLNFITEHLFYIIADIKTTDADRRAFMLLALTGGAPKTFFPQEWYNEIQDKINTLPKKNLEDYQDFETPLQLIHTFIKDYKSDFGELWIRDYSWLGFPTIKIENTERKIDINNSTLYTNSTEDILSFWAHGYGLKQNEAIRQNICNGIKEFNFYFPNDTYVKDLFMVKDNIPIPCMKNMQTYEKDFDILSLEKKFPQYINTFSMNMNAFKEFCI